jgi:CheY-like chemotaxis protein
MEQFSKLAEALSTLLWPIIVIAIIVVFRPAVSSLIESARSRKFTLKIGGQELTMDEAGEQQRALIADLQVQLVELRKRIEGRQVVAAAASTDQPMAPPPAPSSILWVDDNPKNNSYLIEQLHGLGIKVDIALTTSDGLSTFGRRRYNLVISDMGRQEEGTFNSDAGLDLLRAIRERDPNVPIAIYCSSNAVRQYGAEAKRLGAACVTSSATELFGFLNLEDRKA